MNGRLVRVTALFVCVIWACMSTPQAFAQLLGNLIVNMTSPANGSTVSGTVTVTASVTIIGALTVRDVQFKLDGADLGTADTSAPYSVSWNTKTANNGSHTLTAVARDLLGIQYTSSLVTVTVFNDTLPPAVAITAPANGATVSSTVSVTASASDNVGVVGVQFKLDGANLGAEDTSAPYAVSWDTTTTGNGSHALTAVARDAAGNIGTAAPITVTVSNDTSPPAVAITAPANGATVSSTVSVTASASDNVGVVGVQFKLDGANLGAEDTSAPYAVSWDTTTTGNGSHALTAVARDAAGNTATATTVTVTVSNGTASRGDVFLAFANDGHVQWYNPDGSFRQILTGTSVGQASSVAFDAARNLYVPHWENQGPSGNFVERFDPNGNYLGIFGSGYNCNPSTMTFDAAGNMYVGQADCTGNILKLDAAGNLVTSYAVLTTNRGTDHIDLAPDGCTMFYTSRDANVYRFNVCTNTQLLPFNTQPLPGDIAYHVRVLPDGGVLVADGTRLVRLDASGNLVPTSYFAPGESNYWGGVDHIGDGTFWATNADTDTAYRFDLQSGAILTKINAGTSGFTLAGLGVRP